MPWVGLQFVSVVFPQITHLLNIFGGKGLFLKINVQNGNIFGASLKFQYVFGYASYS